MTDVERYIESLAVQPTKKQVQEIRKWWATLSERDRKALKPRNVKRNERRQKPGTFVIDIQTLENRPPSTPYSNGDRKVLKGVSRKSQIQELLEVKHFIESLSPDDERLVSLMAAGYTMSEVAKLLCVHKSTVSRRLKRSVDFCPNT